MTQFVPLFQWDKYYVLSSLENLHYSEGHYSSKTCYIYYMGFPGGPSGKEPVPMQET